AVAVHRVPFSFVGSCPFTSKQRAERKARLFRLRMRASSSRDDGRSATQTSALRAARDDAPVSYGAADRLSQSKAPRVIMKSSSSSSESSSGDGDVEEKGQPDNVEDITLKNYHAARPVPKTREIDPGKTFAKKRKRTSGAGADGGASNGGGSEDGEGGSDGLASKIMGLALPTLVTLCVDPFMSAVDTAYIGRLDLDLGGSEEGLQAQGLNTYVFTFAFYVFGFLTTVPTPFVAAARAKGDVIGAAK
ncbi:unnamed protein product, partial [Ascophyllum nodosum]